MKGSDEATVEVSRTDHQRKEGFKPNKSEESVLQHAAAKGHDTGASLLLERGLDINAKGKGGKIVLYCATLNSRVAII